MRGAFIRGLTALAEHDDRIVLLTGDLGFSAIEPFSDRFPGRFVNVGVAEQNMVGLAVGLAEAGYVPFVYSIATFATLRPYEFIRNGPVLQRLPVRIVGVGGGFEYGPAGPTHHALEDVGVMRLQPGLTVIAPADYQQTATALAATWDLPGPVYYRLGKDERNVVPGLEGRFDTGRLQRLRGGTDLLLLGMGSLCRQMEVAAEALAGRGVSVASAVLACLAPPPVDDLCALLSAFDTVLTIEGHYAVGGLGSLVCEVVATHGLACTVHRCAVGEAATQLTGSEQYLLERHGLAPAGLVAAALEALASV